MFQKPSLSRTALFLLIGILLLGFICSTPELFAQEAADAAEELVDDAAPPTSLWGMIKQGGWAMWPLGALSMMWVALVVFNFLQLNQKKFAPADLQTAVLENMGECRVRSAIEVSAGSPTYLGRMLAMSLPHVDATNPETLGRDDVEDAVADFTVKENRGYMASIQYFAILAQAAPMLGLLGTVSGMIKAFSTLSVSGGSDPSKLAGNISEALMTTATGLVIALPALFAFFFFKNRLAKLVGDCHTVVTDSMDASLTAIHADQQLAKVPEGLQAG